MVTASRAAAGVLVATAIVLATSCTRIVDDARVVAAADIGKGRLRMDRSARRLMRR